MKIEEFDYDLEIEKVIEEINKQNAKSVCLQLADGLKPRAKEIVDEIKDKCPYVKVLIWLGACFGACDIPISLTNKVDLTVQFGHNRFVKNIKGWK